MQTISKNDRAVGSEALALALSDVIKNPSSVRSDEVIKAAADILKYLDSENFQDVELPNLKNKELQSEWAKIFYGASEEDCVSLTASFWLGPKALAAGEMTEEAINRQRSAGLSFTGNLPEDSLAVGLAFISELIKQQKFSEAQAYYDEFIDSWFDKAFDYLDQRAQNPETKNFFLFLKRSVNALDVQLQELTGRIKAAARSATSSK